MYSLSFRYLLLIGFGVGIALALFYFLRPVNRLPLNSGSETSRPANSNSTNSNSGNSNPGSSQPGSSLPIDSTPESPPIQEESGRNPIGNQTEDCAITSCHGLQIECGADAPQLCTMEYRLGDFCRQFADCRVVNDECQFVDNSYFMNCKSCVQNCEAETADPMAAFECENQCREQFESIL
jgi:hypothetical protein